MPRPTSNPSEASGASEEKLGLNSDRQPELVPPSDVNLGDRGVADDKALAGGVVNLDDFDAEHPRGNTARTGGTWSGRPSDKGSVGPAPNPGLSNRNGPSDPAGKRDLDLDRERS